MMKVKIELSPSAIDLMGGNCPPAAEVALPKDSTVRDALHELQVDPRLLDGGLQVVLNGKILDLYVSGMATVLQEGDAILLIAPYDGG